jgi:dipeptidyl aminopeptidase/acylaminoacyl peptidase
MSRLFRPSDVWQLRTVGDPRLASDGRHVAFTVSWPDRDTDTFCTSIDIASLRDGQTKRISQMPSAHSPRWSPDGLRLLYLSRGEHADTMHIFQLADLSETAVDLPGRASNPSWSPEGRHVALTIKSDPTKRSAQEGHAPKIIDALHYRMDELGYRPMRQQLGFVDVGSGTVELITDDAFLADEAAWSPDGRRLAFVADRRPGWQQRHSLADLWVRDLVTGAEQALTNGTGHATQPAFSKDGAHIAFLGYDRTPYYDRHQRLLVVAADGTQAVRCLAPALDRSIGAQQPSGRQFCWLADSRSLLLLRASAGCVGIVRTDLEAANITDELLADDRQVEGFDASGTGDLVVFASQWPSRPSEGYLFTGGRTTQLTGYHDRRPWRGTLAPLRRIAWTGGTGTRLTGFATRPPQPQSGRSPLVLDVHGGPHGFHPYPPGVWHLQSLVSAGFAVLLPNPRGSGDDTEEFRQLVTRHWGDRNLEDVLPLVDEAVADGSADPARLYMFGSSYGGYLTAYATTRTSQFAAAAVSAGMVNLASALGTSDIPDYFSFEIGDPERDAAEFRTRSPIATASAVRTPTLLLHWEGDLRCPVSQAEEWFTALQLNDVPVRFVRYPGGSHSSRTPSQLVDRLERVIDWYAQWPG